MNIIGPALALIMAAGVMYFGYRVIRDGDIAPLKADIRALAGRIWSGLHR